MEISNVDLNTDVIKHFETHLNSRLVPSNFMSFRFCNALTKRNLHHFLWENPIYHLTIV